MVDFPLYKMIHHPLLLDWSMAIFSLFALFYLLIATANSMREPFRDKGARPLTHTLNSLSSLIVGIGFFACMIYLWLNNLFGNYLDYSAVRHCF